MNELIAETIKPLATREEAKKQWDYWTDKLKLRHSSTFDEMYDTLVEMRLKKQRELNFRKNILEFEQKLEQKPGTLKGDIHPLEHIFADGLYIRTLTVPPNTLTVTKIHAVNHAFFLQKGTMSIFTEDGVKKITAPYQGITKAGTKRIIYHHDEVVFTTVHATKEIDIEKIELEVIAEDFDWLDNKLEAERFIDFIEILKEEN